MSFLDIPQKEILAFSLVLLRIMAFVTAWPILGGANVPVSSKVLFSLLLAMVLFPTVRGGLVGLNISGWMDMISAGVIQIAIGMALAFLANFFFYMINSGGNLISMSMGLSSSQLYNPGDGQSSYINRTILLLVGRFVLFDDSRAPYFFSWLT